MKDGFTAKIELEDTVPPSGNAIVRVYDSDDILIDILIGQYGAVMSALRRLHHIPRGRTVEVVYLEES